MATVMWSFKTKNFRIIASIKHDWSYVYDGDDEAGETQAALNAGSLVAFDASVIVYMRGQEVGAGPISADRSTGSTMRRHSLPTIVRPIRRSAIAPVSGRNSGTLICHYFPDMVRDAIANARGNIAAIRSVKLREVAA